MKPTSNFESEVPRIALTSGEPAASVNHGTALELTGSGRADPDSFTAAVHVTLHLAAQRVAS